MASLLRGPRRGRLLLAGLLLLIHRGALLFWGEFGGVEVLAMEANPVDYDDEFNWGQDAHSSPSAETSEVEPPAPEALPLTALAHAPCQPLVAACLDEIPEEDEILYYDDYIDRYLDREDLDEQPWGDQTSVCPGGERTAETYLSPPSSRPHQDEEGWIKRGGKWKRGVDRWHNRDGTLRKPPRSSSYSANGPQRGWDAANPWPCTWEDTPSSSSSSGTVPENQSPNDVSDSVLGTEADEPETTTAAADGPPGAPSPDVNGLLMNEVCVVYSGPDAWGDTSSTVRPSFSSGIGVDPDETIDSYVGVGSSGEPLPAEHTDSSRGNEADLAGGVAGTTALENSMQANVGFYKHGVWHNRPRTAWEQRAHSGGQGPARTARRNERCRRWFNGEWRPAWLEQYKRDKAQRESTASSSSDPNHAGTSWIAGHGLGSDASSSWTSSWTSGATPTAPWPTSTSSSTTPLLDTEYQVSGEHDESHLMQLTGAERATLQEAGLPEPQLQRVEALMEAMDVFQDGDQGPESRWGLRCALRRQVCLGRLMDALSGVLERRLRVRGFWPVTRTPGSRPACNRWWHWARQFNQIVEELAMDHLHRPLDELDLDETSRPSEHAEGIGLIEEPGPLPASRGSSSSGDVAAEVGSGAGRRRTSSRPSSPARSVSRSPRRGLDTGSVLDRGGGSSSSEVSKQGSGLDSESFHQDSIDSAQGLNSDGELVDVEPATGPGPFGPPPPLPVNLPPAPLDLQGIWREPNGDTSPTTTSSSTTLVMWSYSGTTSVVASLPVNFVEVAEDWEAEGLGEAGLNLVQRSWRGINPWGDLSSFQPGSNSSASLPSSATCLSSSACTCWTLLSTSTSTSSTLNYQCSVAGGCGQGHGECGVGSEYDGGCVGIHPSPADPQPWAAASAPPHYGCCRGGIAMAVGSTNGGGIQCCSSGEGCLGYHFQGGPTWIWQQRGFVQCSGWAECALAA